MEPRPDDVDVDAATRASLEFDRVLEDVAGEARTAPGRDAVLASRPTRDPARARERVAAVDEMTRLLAGRGRPVPGGLPDPRPALTLLRIADAHPRARDLRDLAAFVAFAAELRARLGEAAEEDGLPRLEALARSAPDLGVRVRAILAAIEPDGRLADDASEGLRRIRRDMARVGARLRALLEGMLRDPGAAGRVQDEFVTQRNGRFVIPVRADAHGGVRGIVHASSSSGATLFVEPLESVESNNQLVRLQEQEAEETERILAAWSDGLRAVQDDVSACVDAVTRADALQARAVWAERAGAVLPEFVDEGALRLVGARHPLLDRRLRERGDGCVPITIVIDPWDRVLVLSGPNAGGKTVALKTLGLAPLLAQAGIPVPAESARLPVFGQVRADIGDHQSLAADLSTFSAHLGATRDVLRDLRPPALVLFDEIGTGTDPAEGAALAQAVLERLGRSGVTTAATTHHGAVKAWAFGRCGVVSAALEFDRETLRPTYRVLTGAAGVSAGLDVAERLGLDGDVVARARALIGEDAVRAEVYLERLRERMAELERERAELGERARAIERSESEVAARIDREVARVRDEAARRFDEQVVAFRELGRREIENLKDGRERERARRAQREAERRLATEAARRRDRVARTSPADVVPTPRDWSPRAGDRVRIVSFDRDGIVEAVDGDRVTVRLGAVSFRVALADVRRQVGEAPSTPGGSSGTARPRVPEDDLAPGPEREINLIGRTVVEALPEVDRFLDRAVRAGWPEVRIVHGHGTGRLRAAIRSHLRGHPLGRRHRSGGPGEGGDGATVVVFDGAMSGG